MPCRRAGAAGTAAAMWTQVLGSEGNTDGDGNAADISTGLGGFIAGLDVAAAANWRAGFFGSFSQSHYSVDDRNSSGNATSFGGGIYAGGRSGAASLRAGAALAWNDMSADRSIAFPGYSGSTSADYGTTTAQVFGEATYDVTLGSALLQPFAGLAYVKVAGSAFEEDGDSAALDVDTKSMDTVYAVAGLRASTTVPLKDRSLVPSAALAWQGAFGDTTPEGSMTFADGTTPFTISGDALAEDTLLVQAGLALDLTDQALLAVDYWGQFGSGTAQNAFTARFSVTF